MLILHFDSMGHDQPSLFISVGGDFERLAGPNLFPLDLMEQMTLCYLLRAPFSTLPAAFHPLGEVSPSYRRSHRWARITTSRAAPLKDCAYF